MKYPKTLYQNVLLINGKMVNWKTGTTHWENLEKAFMNRQPWYILQKLNENITVESRSKIVNNIEENNLFFKDTSWYKQFEFHENFNVLKPY